MLIVIAAGIIGLGQLTGALGQIRDFIQKKDSSTAPATNSADPVARTYARLKYDLQRLDRQLTWVSDLDTARALGALTVAGQRAGVVCDYRTKLAEVDNAPGVRIAERACAYARLIQLLDSVAAIHSGEVHDDDLMIAKRSSIGLRQILRDSASSLMGDSNRASK